MDPDNPQSTAYTFLRWRWPDPVDGGWLTLCYRADPGSPVKVEGAYPITTDGMKKLAADAIRLASDADTWVLLNGLGGEPPPRRKGGEVGLRYLVGLHEDLDKNVDNPVEFLLGLGDWRPNIIVDSGNGVHAYWLYSIDVDLLQLSGGKLEELHRVRGEYRMLAARFHAWLEQQAGCKFDDCSNLDRIMRLPGTWNRKRTEHKLVQVVQPDDGRRFHPQRLMELVKDVQLRARHLGDDADFGKQGTLSDSEAGAVIERLVPVYVHRANTGADGGRNHSIFKLAQQLNDHYVGRDLALDAVLTARGQLSEYTATGEHDPLTTEELATTVASAYRLAPRGPAQAPGLDPLELAEAKQLAERLAGLSSRPVIEVQESGVDNPFAGAVELLSGAAPVPLPRDGGAGSGAAIGHHQATATPAAPVPRGRNTDVDNGLALAEFAQGRLAYVADEWWAWNGVRWMPDSLFLRFGAVRELVDSFLVAAMTATEQVREVLISRAQRLSMVGGRDAALNTAREHLVLDPDLFDADEWLLNCRNGLVDLRTGVIRPVTPGDYVSRVVDVDYVPGARDDVWERVLPELIPDRSDREWLQRWFGYCLTGSVVEKAILCLYGPADSGKSTISESMRATLGNVAAGGYATSWASEVIELHGQTNRLEKLSQSIGARLVISAELNDGARMASGFVKEVSGGDSVDAKALYKASRTITPRFKLLLHTNHVPKTSDPALQKRLRFIYLDRALTHEEKDPAVKRHLEESEAARTALLAWAIEGARLWAEQGLGMPARQEAELKKFMAESDHLYVFVEECVVVEHRGVADGVEAHAGRRGGSRSDDAGLPVGGVTKAQMRTGYERWCVAQGYQPVKPMTFKHGLERYGLVFDKPFGGGTQNVWRGVTLVGEAAGAVDGDGNGNAFATYADEVL